MINERKIEETHKVEIKNSNLSTDILQGETKKNAVDDSKRTFLGCSSFQFMPAILIAIFFLAILGSVALATLEHSAHPDTSLNFEANVNDNKVTIKGEEPLHDGATIKIMAHREIVFNNFKKGDVLITSANTKILGGQFVSVLVLDDSEWYNRKLAKDVELGSEEAIDITNNVIITALYIPEELRPFPDGEEKSKTVSIATKQSSGKEQKMPQVLPRYGQVIIEYPFTAN